MHSQGLSDNVYYCYFCICFKHFDMNTIIKLPDKGDPSDILQLFPRLNLQLLCCRYWWLTKWEFRELAYPYWRIYYNKQKGASIVSDGHTYTLTPDKIYLIAPNTSYSTCLFNQKTPKTGYALEGNRIGKHNSSPPSDKDKVEHLFIHFNIGIPYDNISPGIFTFELTPHLEDKIEIITSQLNVDSSHINFYSFLAIQSLISDLLSEININCWELLAKDYRILDILSYIENNNDKNLSNKVLAEKCQLATNSFTRLFKEEVNISPQSFVKQKRINNACVKLHHSDESIDAIAQQTGFVNRYHFSRIFKQVTGLSPARYRKEFRIR